MKAYFERKNIRKGGKENAWLCEEKKNNGIEEAKLGLTFTHNHVKSTGTLAMQATPIIQWASVLLARPRRSGFVIPAYDTVHRHGHTEPGLIA